jgi:hypothetical protein
MALRTSAVAFSLLRAAAGRGAAAQAGAGLLAGQTLPHALLQRASTSAAAQPAADAPKQPQNVPEGHRGSDLSSTVCNIGLGRRRDLTLRQDLCLHAADGAKLTLATVFKARRRRLSPAFARRRWAGPASGCGRGAQAPLRRRGCRRRRRRQCRRSRERPAARRCRRARRCCWWASRAARCASSSTSRDT